MAYPHALLLGVFAIALTACNADTSTAPKTPTPPTTLATAPATAVPSLPTLSPVLPTQESFGGTVSIPALQHDFDVFSWESFIALNWPANSDGSANTQVTIGQAPEAMRVWQHYKESRDIFLPNGETPPGWNQANPPPAVCKAADGTRVLTQAGKTPNVLDESGEPFQTGPLIDQNGQYARFEILTNQVMFDYIIEHQLYSQTGQQTFAADADFPFSTDTKVGSIMLKAAWKIIGANDDPTGFYTTDAYVYDNPDENAGVEAHCQLKKVGLVGLHIGTKVKNNPQWIWSTFEHVNNAPTQGGVADKPHYNFWLVSRIYG